MQPKPLLLRSTNPYSESQLELTDPEQSYSTNQNRFLFRLGKEFRLSPLVQRHPIVI